ncbi:MAG: nucleotidyltransferase [Candidatus Aegiribacteria sp.]|nr:nucleotidyltransferase [Candidatus Aegiribacteria sp.]
MRNREDILNLLSSHQDEIKGFGVIRCGLFGSYVRNEASDNSDIDILVEFRPDTKNYKNYIHLVFYLEDLLGMHVDLVTKEALSPYIGPHIMREVKYVPFSA